jgi:uncharacterized protein YdaL
VLYDTSSEYGYLGELYATAIGVLVSHFGAWRASPVQRYQAGDLSRARAVIYIGSSFDEPLPPAFLNDVRSAARPVVWIADNIWQLSSAMGDKFAATYGFAPTSYAQGDYGQVVYKQTHLDRDRSNRLLMQFTGLDTGVAKVLAWVEAGSGRQLPWALRGAGLTYVAENPLAFIGPTDRYYAFCDLLFDVLAPNTPERHRALLRIEDVHPNTPPSSLLALADYLYAAEVPYSIALVPQYADPLGASSGGTPSVRWLHDSPAVVDAIRYMLARGGNVVLHGYSHQYEREKNPYSGASIDDFEFFRAHIDEQNNVVWDGPVAEDSAQWAADRVQLALAEIARAGLPKPTIFEYPHYGGSVVDSYEIAKHFRVAFQRASYYGGILSGSPIDYSHSINMTFPFVVHDIFGWKLIPENLGNYIPVGYNNHGTEGPTELQRAAKAQHVVRDGVVSFFFHPIFDVSVLKQIVEAVRTEGYEFVSPNGL